MQRFRYLLNRRVLQQSQSPLPTYKGSFQLQNWLPLQRELSISCPALSNSDLPGGGDRGDGNSNDSPAYDTISDILNVTTKSRDDVQWQDRRASNDLSSINQDENAAKKDGEGKDDPRPIITYASGPGGSTQSGVILGIETSCDDTGVAVVNTDKQVLGEALNSQLQIHLK
jgi:hypothetical protein